MRKARKYFTIGMIMLAIHIITEIWIKVTGRNTTNNFILFVIAIPLITYSIILYLNSLKE